MRDCDAIEHTVQIDITNQEGRTWESTAVLTFDSDSPYVVRWQFGSTNGSEWLISRDVFAIGMVTMVHEGPVQIYPHPTREDSIAFSFDAPNALMMVRVNRLEVEDFLADTFEIVAEGDEEVIAFQAFDDYLAGQS